MTLQRLELLKSYTLMWNKTTSDTSLECFPYRTTMRKLSHTQHMQFHSKQYTYLQTLYTLVRVLNL